MKKLFFVFSVLLLTFQLSAQNFTLKSNDVKGQAQMQQIFNNFGCKGENKSPQLSWVNPPQGTLSFAITMYDPDAPSGSGWWQWVMFNIPANVMELVQNAGNPELNLAPKGCIQSLNDYGDYGYGGPCPPETGRIHEYIITIYALNVPKLDLTKETNPAMVGFYINAHTIQKASVVMYYQRNKK